MNLKKTVITKTYLFTIIDKNLNKRKIEIEAESPSAAVLLLPEGVKSWWLLGEN